MNVARQQPGRSQSVPCHWHSLIARLASVVSLVAISMSSAVAGPPKSDIEVMAHRGHASIAPENSRAALEKGAEDGIEWAEVDIRLSQDRHHVLIHDANIDSKSNGKGAVRELTLPQLQALEMGGWFAPRFSQERVLTLIEALKLCRHRIGLVLDCKDCDPVTLVKEILAAEMQQHVIVYGDHDLLVALRLQTHSSIQVMAKWHPELDLESIISQLNPQYLEVDAKHVTPELCQRCAEHGIRIEAKVLGASDQPDGWQAMRNAGATIIQTDHAEDLLAYRLRQRIGVVPHKTQLACHRGASRYAPENTFAALRRAVSLQADYVEIDVRTTRDGRCFLLHDSRLDRTTNLQGPIAEVTSEALREADAGRWFSPAFAREPLPELDAYLTVFAKLPQLQLYFDAKDISVDRLVEALRKHHLIERTIVYQRPEYLKELSQQEPQLRTLGPLPHSQAWELYQKLSWYPHAMDVAWDLVKPELIAACHAKGIRVFADAPDETSVSDYRSAIATGIDCIQTDHPLRLLSALQPE